MHITIKRHSKKKAGFEVERRVADGFYYVTKVPKNCKGIQVGDRVLEINGTKHLDFKNQENANALIDTFKMEVIPVDNGSEGYESEENYEELVRSGQRTKNASNDRSRNNSEKSEQEPVYNRDSRSGRVDEEGSFDRSVDTSSASNKGGTGEDWAYGSEGAYDRRDQHPYSDDDGVRKVGKDYNEDDEDGAPTSDDDDWSDTSEDVSASGNYASVSDDELDWDDDNAASDEDENSYDSFSIPKNDDTVDDKVRELVKSNAAKRNARLGEDESVDEEGWDRPYVSKYNPNDKFMISIKKEEDQYDADLGIDLVEFNRDNGTRGITTDIYVREVVRGAFYQTALDRGDKILAINGKQVPDCIGSVEEAMELIQLKLKVTLYVVRPSEDDEGYQWLIENA